MPLSPCSVRGLTVSLLCLASAALFLAAPATFAASKPVRPVMKDSPMPPAARPVIPAREVWLTAFGAKGDGLELNTEAFAKAIATVAEQGGGTVMVPPGIWLTGPIELRSRVRLHLEAGALIQFSGDPSLYPVVVHDKRGEKEVDSVSPISGLNLEDVAITGSGVIDGGGKAWRYVKKMKLTANAWAALVKSGGVVNASGEEWWPSQAALDGSVAVEKLRASGSLDVAAYEPYRQYLRPRLLRIQDTKRLLLEGVTFQNPPNWTVNPVLCEDVSILGVKVLNSEVAQNSDALDIESCRRVLVRGCLLDVGDDGICLKSGKDLPGRRIGVPTEDVLVQDCTVYYAHGGFTIGSEMSGGVRNVRVDNCTFIGTAVGLRFKSARGRGGLVENIRISNIRMVDIVRDAISFNFYYGGKSPIEDTSGPSESAIPVTDETPVFRDILIENVVARGAANALVLYGLPEMPLTGLVLRNVSISARQGASIADVDKLVFQNVDLRVSEGPKVRSLRAKDSVLDVVP